MHRPARHHLYDPFELIVQWGPAGRPFGAQPPPGALHGLLEPRGVHRLQQVVDGIHFECLDGVPVEGGDEYQRGRLVVPLQETASHLESRETRHLDVEEHEVRLVTFNGGERFYAVARLRDNL